MVHGVAQQVQERVADLIDHRPVEPGLLPLHDKAHLFAAFPGQVAHHAGEAVEHVLDR